MANRVTQGVGSTLLRASVLLGSSALLLDQCLYNVQPGHRGLIFDRFAGVKDEVYPEGTHFMIPFWQRPVIMDVRTTPRTISTVSGTKDLQNVNLSLRILFRPDVEHLPSLYRDLDLNYADRVLPGLANEVLKAVVARYNADQLLALRDKVSMEVRELLRKRCQGFHINLDDVSITHLGFSPEFSRAIEDKQVAQQRMEKAEYLVMRAEQEKLKAIINGSADAEAAQLVSDAIKEHGRGLIEVRRIEAAQEIADTLSKSKQGVVYLPGGQQMLLNVQR
jgi:prohibitin 1